MQSRLRSGASAAQRGHDANIFDISEGPAIAVEGPGNDKKRKVSRDDHAAQPSDAPALAPGIIIVPPPYDRPTFYCETCSRLFPQCQQKSHLNSKMHQRRKEATAPNFFHCDTCSLRLHIGQKESHLKGRRHKGNVAATTARATATGELQLPLSLPLPLSEGPAIAVEGPGVSDGDDQYEDEDDENSLSGDGDGQTEPPTPMPFSARPPQLFLAVRRPVMGVYKSWAAFREAIKCADDAEYKLCGSAEAARLFVETMVDTLAPPPLHVPAVSAAAASPKIGESGPPCSCGVPTIFKIQKSQKSGKIRHIWKCVEDQCAPQPVCN